MLLSEYTKTLYYRLVSPTLCQQQLPKIGALLFKDLPGSHEKELHISENGYFSYRREDAFKYAGSAPEMEKEAKTIANTFLQEKGKKVSEYFAEKNIALPAIFPNSLYFVKATASYDKVGETSKLNHWCIEYGLRLPVLKWDKNTPALVASVLAEYESPFAQTEDKSAALKDLVNKHLYAPVENASLKVYVGAKQKVIGMDYAFPLLETQPTPTALLNAPDRTRLSGLQAAEDMPALPDFMFREVNGLVVPFYIDGVAACREGVDKKKMIPDKYNDILSLGKDFHVLIDTQFLTMHFYVHVYYNRNNEMLRTDLLNLWESKKVRIKQMKLSDFKEVPSIESNLYEAANRNEKDVYWLVSFNTRFVPYDGPLKNPDFEVKDRLIENIENPEFVHKKKILEENSAAIILTYGGKPPGTSEFSAKERVITLLSTTLNSENRTFSHELGHLLVHYLDSPGFLEANTFNHKDNPLWRTNNWTSSNPAPLMSYTLTDINKEIFPFEYECVLIRTLEKLAYFKLQNPDYKAEYTIFLVNNFNIYGTLGF